MLATGSNIRLERGLFPRFPAVVPPDDVADKNHMGVDKKVEAGRPRFVLFRKVVECRVKIDAPADLPRQTLMGATGPV